MGFVALMMGCASGGKAIVDASQTRLQAARQVGSFAEIPSIDLRADYAQTYPIGADKDESANYAIAFDSSERVYGRVFRLPTWQAAYSITMSSIALGNLSDPAIFYPRYVLLDEKFKPTQQGAARDFTYRGGVISATLFVNEVDRGEAYIAVLGETRGAIKEETSLLQSAGSVPVSVPIKGFLVTWLIPTGGKELPTLMRGTAGGLVEFKLTTYKPKQY